MKNRILQLIEDAQRVEIEAARLKSLQEQTKKPLTDEEKARKLPTLSIGDTVDVHMRILEGQKERMQVFSGVIIAMRGEGLQESFTVRRIVQGEGVERVFPLLSSKIAKIEVKRSGKVRRAKLFYLRDRVGKATRLKERKVKVPEGGVATATATAAKKGAKKKK